MLLLSCCSIWIVLLLVSDLCSSLTDVVPWVAEHVHWVQIGTVRKIRLLDKLHLIEVVGQCTLFEIGVSLVRGYGLLSTLRLHGREWCHDERICGEWIKWQIIEA